MRGKRRGENGLQMTETDDSRDRPTSQPTWRGTNQGRMREANERLVLSLLRRGKALAKADIARETGLSAQTVARLVGRMEEDGLIRRGEARKGRVGQPSVPLSIDPLGAVFLGLKVGRRSVELVAIDFEGKVLDRERQVHDYPDFDRVRDFAISAPEELIGRLPEELRPRVAGLGIALPFFLWDWAPQIGVPPARMANWKTRDLQAEVAEALDMPVFLQNDASSVSSAELVFGAGSPPRNALTIFLAFFVGGGLVLEHRLYTGSTDNAAGLGPLIVTDRDGRPTPLIDLASLCVLERRLQGKGYDPRRMWEDPTSWDFPPELVQAWIDDCGHALGQAIHAVQALLDLDVVLIEGWMPRAQLSEVVARTRTAFEKADRSGISTPRILPGTVGPDARAIGAASLPLSDRFLPG